MRWLALQDYLVSGLDKARCMKHLPNHACAFRIFIKKVNFTKRHFSIYLVVILRRQLLIFGLLELLK